MSILFEIADMHAMSFCSTPSVKSGSICNKSASTSPSLVPSVAPSASTSPLLGPVVTLSSSSSSSSMASTSSVSEKSSQSEQQQQQQQQQQLPSIKAQRVTTTNSKGNNSVQAEQSLKVPQTTFLGWTPPSSPWMRPSVTDEEHMNKLVTFQL